MSGGSGSSQRGHAAPRVRRLQLHGISQGHLVFDAFLLVLPGGAGGTGGGNGRIRGHIFRRGWWEGEKVRAGVAG